MGGPQKKVKPDLRQFPDDLEVLSMRRHSLSDFWMVLDGIDV